MKIADDLEAVAALAETEPMCRDDIGVLYRAANAIRGLDEAHTHEFVRANAFEEELERYKIAVFKISACRFDKKPFEQIDMILKELHDATAV